MTPSNPPLPPHERAALLRIVDANQNRAVEALRVVEEYARFVQNDGAGAAIYKQLRHDLVAAILEYLPAAELLAARDTQHDVGTQVAVNAEYQRADILEVVGANLKRIEQALRAIEEYGKVLAPSLGQSVEQIRYHAYTAAKTMCAPLLRSEQLATACLYVLLDGGDSLDTFVSRAEALVNAGTDIIQLRDKKLCDRKLLDRAKALRRITRGKAIFIMNDRADLAALADVDGVHVGQDELTVADARRIVGPRCLVGVSTHTIVQARAAVHDGADYIGCGPTFPSTTKSFAEFPGVAFLKEVANEIRLPAFAIGGITLDNIVQVRKAGLSRVAVGGAVSQSADITATVQSFRHALAAESLCRE